MGASITINKTADVPGTTFDRCLSFTFRQERYACSATFTGTFAVDGPVGEIRAIEAAIEGHTVLRGFVDRTEEKCAGGERLLTVHARSTAALLGDNFLKPGMYLTVSLDTLVTQLIRLEGVTCQSAPTTLNYIYVSDGRSMWDMIALLCIRLYGVCPYVAQGNVVRYSTGGAFRTVRPERVLSTAFRCDNTRLVSDIHMQDTEGTYDVYQAHSDYPVERGILRHQQAALDMSWLADLQTGLRYRLGYAQRAARVYEAAYTGYTGEDLYDRLSIPEAGTAFSGAGGKIAALTVTGGSGGIVTTASVYDDVYGGLNE